MFENDRNSYGRAAIFRERFSGVVRPNIWSRYADLKSL